MDHQMNEQLLKNVSSAGITPAAPKYEIGDFVDFRESSGEISYGTIIEMYYITSRNRWEYCIKTGKLVPYQIPEKDVIGLNR